MTAEVMRMTSILDIQDEHDRESLALVGARERDGDADVDDDLIS